MSLKFPLALVAFAIAMLALSTRAVRAGEAAHVVLNDSIRKVTQSAETGPVDTRHPYISRAQLKAAESVAPMTIELPLKMRNFAELEARVARGEQISAQELTRKYEPAAADFQSVVAWAKGQGLTITRQDDHRLAVFAQGSVSQVAGALQVNFARVTSAGKEYTSAVTAPTIPSGLASVVLGVTGLQPHLRPHKHLIRSQARPNITLGGSEYEPSQIAQAYDVASLYTSGITGAGQSIAIIIDTFPKSSDLEKFWTTCNISQSINNISFIQTVSGSLPAPSGEETLDTEWASGMAPGAKVRVYAATDLANTDLDTSYQQVLDDAMNSPSLNIHAMTMSYGDGETDTPPSELMNDHQLFTALTALGISCFASAGDGGSTPDDNGGESGSLQPENPADDPSVNGVGGTSLVISDTDQVTSETVWNDGASGGATGGGTSGSAEAGQFAFGRPTWQTGTGVNTSAARQCPDIAATADPNYGGLIVLNGQNEEYGGTSLASPICAAIFTLINEARINAGQAPLGLLGPKIYPLIGTSNFRDITSGNNYTHVSPTKYAAGVGYDECTGIGAPLVQTLEQSLLGPSATATPMSEVTPGATATFVVTGASGSATYQWERQPIGSTGFTALSDNGTYSGSTTATLTVSNATTAMSGDQFECVVHSGSSSVTTNPPSNLAVETPLAVTNLAGSTGQTGDSNGTGTSASFNYPSGVALDSSGNIYVADYANNQIRKVTSSGAVTTPYGNLAGNAGSGNGSGNNASFNTPNAVAADSSNNLYVADSGNNLIRKISGGVVSTLAGTAGNFNNPQGVAVDSSTGNVYVADTGNNVIEKVTSSGVVSILAGQTGVAGYRDGSGTAAQFSGPEAVAVDGSGNVWVADIGNAAIRKITNGTVTTVAGGGYGGYLDGRASSALFNAPTGLAFDSSGNLFITDSIVPNVDTGATYTGFANAGNCVLRKLSAAGAVTTVAGDPGISGSSTGTGTAAKFYSIQAVVCATGGVYVADTYNQLVRAVGSPTGGGTGGGGGTPVTVTLSNLSTTYNGSPQGATVTTSPSGITVNVTYNGSSTVPTAAGSYAVVATVNQTGYSGSATGTLVIAKASATVTLGNLNTTYDGAAQPASVTTTPNGVAVSVTYNNTSTVPVNAGTYSVAAQVSDPNYSGFADGSLVIAKAGATIGLNNLTQTYTGVAQPVTATTTPTGLTTVITYTVNNVATTKVPTAPGSYPVSATISNANYSGTQAGTLVISQATPTITLGSLTAVYNGKAHAATATTVPAGLAVTLTYQSGGGSPTATAPTAVGSYTVVATVNTTDYAGTASGTLNITPVPAVVATSAASLITATSATLSGTVNPEGSATTAGFQYGTSTTYGNSTASQNIGAGSAVVTVTASTSVVGALLPGTTYHYRVAANSAGGTVNGLDKTFVTLTEPMFSPTPATPLLSASGAQVGFSVNPNGVATSAYLIYSTTPIVVGVSSYSQTATQSLGAGKVAVSVSAFLSGLSPNTEYYYEVVTTSAAGTFYSTEENFTTLGFDVTQVIATGQSAPGTAFNFASLGNAAIDGLDGVAFYAKTSSTSTASNAGIWANQGSSALAPIAQTGSTAQGTGGAVFATLSDPVLVYDGTNEDVAFGGTLKVATGLVTAATENGVWASTGGTPGLVAREGSVAPGTNSATFATFSAAGLTTAGDALVSATLTTSTALGVTTANNTGVWEVESGALTLMLRAGETTNTSKTIASFKFLPTETYVNGQTRGFGPATGHLAATATYTDKTSGIIDVTTPGSPQAVATSGQSAAGTSATFATFSSPAINDNDDVAFEATLAGTGVTTTTNAGIWAGYGAGTPALVARTGQVAPGTGTNATFTALSDPVYNDEEAVAFRATLSTGTGLATTATDSGIWSKTANGSLALVVQAGTQAPGCATGVKYGAFTELALDDVNNGVIFLATLTGTGVTTANNTALFAPDNNGNLQLIVRTGDLIGAKTVTALTFLPAEATGNGSVAGQARSFASSSGDLVFNATFSDKSQAIFNVVFP